MMIYRLFVIAAFLGRLTACPSICNCRSDYVDCSNRALTSLPAFQATDKIGQDFHILDASNNRISYLTSRTFANGPFTKVILSNNQLNSSTASIPDNAFTGAVKSIFELDLSGNQLSRLPMALRHLSNITMLDVTDNPIVHSNEFTYEVMKAMGDTMADFRFGSRQLEEWPNTLNHFQQLQKLEVDGINSRLRVVPPDGFHGFETTLLELRIHNTNLQDVPLGISNLRNLKLLHFDDNPFVKDHGVLVQSFPINIAHHKLQELTLNNDGLTKFPEVIKFLRALQKLSLDRNQLDFVSDTTLGGNITINSLTLRNCKLDRVPGALSDLRYLTSLDLSENNIRTIEKNDLAGIHRLNHLKVANTSLEYISADAFSGLHSLLSLNFENSNVTQVPKALQYISPCLQDIYLANNKIDCMCENLVWLRTHLQTCSLSGSPIKVHGDCDTIISTIEDYASTFLPQCPEWKEINHLSPYNRK